MFFSDFHRCWFLTWTCYGQWLPGDERGFVSNKFEGLETEKRRNIPHTPCDRGRSELERKARENLRGCPVWLNREMALVVQSQMEETAHYRNWKIVACSIMSNHVHLLVGVGVPDDPDPSTLMRDFKAYASRKLNQLFLRPQSGKWWTEHGSIRKIDTEISFRRCIAYIWGQDRPLVQWRNDVE